MSPIPYRFSAQLARRFVHYVGRNARAGAPTAVVQVRFGKRDLRGPALDLTEIVSKATSLYTTPSEFHRNQVFPGKLGFLKSKN